MHTAIKIGDSIILATDGRCTGSPGFTGISLSLDVADEAQAEQKFAALADGGKITMPLMKTFFAPKFGMVQDRFGIQWMIVVQHQP